MAHFAELDENNVVLQVVVVDDIHESDGENWCRNFFGTGRWKQTSYNTQGGVHYSPNSNYATPDTGTEFRKNFAGIGYTYDPEKDAFIDYKSSSTWVLDEDTCQWIPPVPYPDDGLHYDWNYDTESWDVAG